MSKIHLYPVRTNNWHNGWLKWSRRKQVLGSILLWADRARVTKIKFDPSSDEPFAYFTENSLQVETEMGPTPLSIRNTMPKFLHDLLHGHPWLKSLRRFSRIENEGKCSAVIKVQDVENHSTSSWLFEMADEQALFTRQGDAS